MAYSIQWYVEKRIVFARYWDELTAQEFREYIVKVNSEFLDRSDAPLVHLLVDVSQAAHLPTLQQLAAGVGKKPHPRTGWTMVIGAGNPATRWIGDFIAKVFKFRYRSFDTLAEAVMFLKDMDATIDWTQVNASALVRQTSV